MKDRLRKRRQSMVIPAKYRYKHERIYATDGKIQILTPSGEWIDMGAVALDVMIMGWPPYGAKG